MLYTEAMTYLPEELLVKVDWATMAHGLEARSPFLDHKVVEFVAKLPSIFKYRRGERKYLLKRAIESYLPKGHFDCPKMGFSIPLNKWFQTELKDYLGRKLFQGIHREGSLLFSFKSVPP